MRALTGAGCIEETQPQLEMPVKAEREGGMSQLSLFLLPTRILVWIQPKSAGREVHVQGPSPLKWESRGSEGLGGSLADSWFPCVLKFNNDVPDVGLSNIIVQGTWFALSGNLELGVGSPQLILSFSLLFSSSAFSFCFWRDCLNFISQHVS